ncbi:hypothetical protein C1H46_004729 [Malus baccata]|uniref:Uncharacterized protein n=1 Tax=Malus baccata TaxID=106549 RepID=A0A540NF58_MALBA|nr:hypothetical protein C1H46_004729 [Malus baccata]
MADKLEREYHGSDFSLEDSWVWLCQHERKGTEGGSEVTHRVGEDGMGEGGMAGCGFSAFSLDSKGKPVLGSTCSTVCFFNPDIMQLTEYKQRFQYLNLPLEILPSSVESYAKPHVTVDSELKTIEELLLLDPTLNKEFPKTDFVVCRLFEDQPPSATATSSVELCTSAANVEKQIANAATPTSFAALEPCAQEIQLPASNKTVKRALFVESEAAKK